MCLCLKQHVIASAHHAVQSDRPGMAVHTWPRGSASGGMGPKWSPGMVTMMRPDAALARPARTALSVVNASSGRSLSLTFCRPTAQRLSIHTEPKCPGVMPRQEGSTAHSDMAAWGGDKASHCSKRHCMQSSPCGLPRTQDWHWGASWAVEYLLRRNV